MKQILPLLAFLIATGTSAQNDVAKAFAISPTLYDLGTKVFPTSNGYAVFGYIAGPSNAQGDIFMLRLDQDGNELSRHIYGENNRKEGLAKGVLPVGNNGWLLAGWRATAPNSGSRVGYLIRVDANGNEMWNKTMSVPGSQIVFTSLTQLPSGDYLAGGNSDDKMALMRFTASGDIVWYKNYNADPVVGMYISEAGGNCFVASRSQVAKIRTSDGALSWIKAIELPVFGDPDGSISASLNDIVSVGNGQFAVTGDALNDAIFDFEEAMYASLWKENGDIVWIKVYPRNTAAGTGSFYGNSLLYLPNQHQLLLSGQGGPGLIVTRIDLSGKTLETNDIPIPGGGYNPILGKSNGVYFATGGSFQNNMNACFYRSGGNWLPNGSQRPEERTLSNPVRFNLYPNPASHTLNLDFFSETAGNRGLQIFSNTGQEVLRTEQAVAPGHNNLGIQIDALPNGMYWLVSPEGCFAPKAWIKG